MKPDIEDLAAWWVIGLALYAWVAYLGRLL